MNDHDTVLANCVGHAVQGLWGLVMPASSYSLQDEANFLKILWVLAFPKFVGGEAIAIGGKRFNYMLERVRSYEPGLAINVLLDTFDLLIDAFGNEQVGAVVEVLQKALTQINSCAPFQPLQHASCMTRSESDVSAYRGAEDTCCCGHKRQGTDAVWNKRSLQAVVNAHSPNQRIECF